MLRYCDSVGGDSDQLVRWVPHRPQKICCEVAGSGFSMSLLCYIFVVERGKWMGMQTVHGE
jgi:hypothetical protein